MKSGLSLHERRRLLTDSELQSVPWLAHLLSDERDRIVPELRVSEAAPGDLVCRIGRPATYWFGVIDGLLKMNTVTDDGRAITYSGLAAGGWFGEGTVLKRESYRYNIQALRKSRVAGLPVDTFHWLLDQSIGFNRFVMNQLNERLSQFIGVVGAGRSASPEQRLMDQRKQLSIPQHRPCPTLLHPRHAGAAPRPPPQASPPPRGTPRRCG